MRSRGIGYGTALAIIVMTIIILMGMYKITETYIKSETALQKYSEAMQKPHLRITATLINENGINVTITNDGPGGVYIKQVYLYKENTEGVPAEAVPSDMQTGAFLPLGGQITVHFPVTDTENYVFWDKPLRILVETDKGVIDLAFRQPTTRVYVNIHLPSWAAKYQNLVDRILPGLNLEIDMPSQIPLSHFDINLQPALTNPCSAPQMLPPAPHFQYYACLSEDRTTVTVYLDVISGMEYRVRLYGKNVSLPIIMQTIDAVRTGPTTTLGFNFQTVTISYTSRFAATPGSSVTIDFKIPDVTWENKRVRVPNNASTSYVIDFSWMLKPVMKDDKYEWDNMIVSPGMNSATEPWRALLTVAGPVISTVAVQGCGQSNRGGLETVESVYK